MVDKLMYTYYDKNLNYWLKSLATSSFQITIQIFKANEQINVIIKL